MSNYLKDFTKRFFPVGFEALPEHDRRVAKHFVERLHISRNIDREFEDERTVGQRVADRVAAFGGSWTFILLFMAILCCWIALNTFILARRGGAFDPYPYILLNLFLSMLAALQAPIIMMSQNRHAAKDRLDAAHDYEVNLKAELEILSLHEKVDELRDKQWAELIRLQQDQMELLRRLLRECGDGTHDGATDDRPGRPTG
jgi:uncharacterized membrane protein